jgi:hypothetical protein
MKLCMAIRKSEIIDMVWKFTLQQVITNDNL